MTRQWLGAGLAIAAASAVAQTAPAAGAAAQPAPGASATAQTAPTNRALSGVTVYGTVDAIGGLQKTYSGGQLARGGNLGLLGITDLMNVPFSTTNYTAELIENQQARSVADVVMNDASVRTLTSRGGFGDDFQIRGFQVGNGDLAINGLLGLAPSTRIPLEFVERVEVLKGPGALTTGVGPSGSIGGSINVVTKRANDIPLTRLTTTYMGKSQLGAHLDVGRRFGEDNQWGVRVNGVVRAGEGNIDGGRQDLNLGALGLDFAGTRTRWSLDLLATGGETREFRPQTSFAANATAVPAPPSARSNFYPGQKLDDNVRTVMTRLEHDLTDSTMVYAGLGATRLDYQQNLPTGRPDASGNFNVQNAWYDQDTRSTAADAGLRTRFNTGSVRHTLVFGANFLDQDTAYFYATSPTTNPSNLDNPAPLPAITALRGAPGRSSAVKQHSVAVADTLSFAGDRFLVTLGLRRQTLAQDNFNPASGAQTSQYDASATTPLAGVVFKPAQNVSLYANHTAGLTRGATAGVTTANAGQTFAPQKSRQQEVGVKVDWGRLTTQAAVYQIERPSSFTDPVTNVFSFGGEQRNRGLELTAYGELQRSLRLMASAAFQQARLSRTAGGVNQGNDAAGVPERTFNLGLDWDTPWVQGLALNGRVISTSSVFADAANRLRVGDWTRLDIGARYATRMAGKPLTLRANLENVGDKRYWVVSNYVTVGAPRTLMLSATVDF
ncbi:MAG TPA: TonB-dependent siderophore receptor [Ramlibacter sp.]|uniref:TonB-dependent receptor n=1 Tax=Ramlibacter sp. TaxID=1917967 RepID=UPI002D5DB44E|nr:TonB-dependent siderophore receptor [Ramlibacter sp.]HZY18996.1 TonB-dependent siderophore receptor [Ramlibacter sp.]